MSDSALETVIAAGRGGLRGSLVEGWRHRELLWFLALRDIKVRYKQTVLGVAWAVLQPLATMVVFTVVFRRMMGLTTGTVPYPVFAFAGLLPWMLFQNALGQSSNSLVGQAHLLSKVYFPRLLVPLSPVLSGLIDFGISMVVLAGLMAWYGQVPGWGIVLLPLFIVLAVVSALAVGLWFAALSVRYRDFRHVVPFISRMWMFLSPVAYPSEKLAEQLPERFRWLIDLNPMTGVLDGFRWALLGGSGPLPSSIMVSTAAVLVVLVTGLFYFRKVERTMADLL
jgi:lipopolysaccharide transport system permease protein